jgi:hypothetical protein
MEDFNFDGEDNMEDFDADNLDLKVSPFRVMKSETKIEIKPSKLKDDYKVKEKEESEEPPKWFLTYAADVRRLEQQLNVTMEK